MKRAGDGRNSSIEILRVIGILLILFNHVLQEDILSPGDFPISVASNLLARLGGLGDVLFFGITCFFLASSNVRPTFKSSMRRVWLLERQLLTYSLGLFAACLFLWQVRLGFSGYSISAFLNLAIRSLTPVSSGLWWYPAAYAIFLLLYPFLDGLLRKMGREAHGCLAAILFILVSVPIPSGLTYLGWTPVLFVYQYVVFSYVVWHLRPKADTCKWVLLAGAVIGLAGPIQSGLLGGDFGDLYLNNPWSLPAMAIGFSLVLLAAGGKMWNSVAINKVASCAFAAYLILCYPMTWEILDRVVTSIAVLPGWQRMFLEMGFSVAVLAVAVVVDSVRQYIFSLTVDRHRGGVFEVAWEALSGRLPGLRELE